MTKMILGKEITRYREIFSLFTKKLGWQKRLKASASFSTAIATGKKVRVRFAPSPTGFLHLGGFRTALLNYLFAVKHEGKFLLRIEDTDQTRLVPGALKQIQDDLKWLGIEPHESPTKPGNHGPYIQSERLQIYQESLNNLIDSGHAYECFCTERRLELMKREAMRLRQKHRYDNKCRELTREDVKRKKAAGEPYCVRFKLEPELVSFDDMVYGNVEFDLTGMLYDGDLVIVKSDGYPTYHFANVVDDHHMEISHVLRGVEWQISTPKHLQMFRAFKWDPPKYAHLPLVMNKDGTKLSKRQGDVSIKHYRDQTYYPIALTNFVTKSGGGFSYHGVDKLCNLQELADTFNIEYVNRGGCKLDFALLEQLNKLELERRVREDIPSLSKVLAELIGTIPQSEKKSYEPQYLEKVLRWCPTRVGKVKDLVSPELEYLWCQPSENQLSKIKLNPEIIHRFVGLCQNDLLGTTNEMLEDPSEIFGILEKFSETHKLNYKLLFKDLRTILCGLSKGPPIAELLQILGKDEVLNRLFKYLEHSEIRRNDKTFLSRQ